MKIIVCRFSVSLYELPLTIGRYLAKIAFVIYLFIFLPQTFATTPAAFCLRNLSTALAIVLKGALPVIQAIIASLPLSFQIRR